MPTAHVDGQPIHYQDTGERALAVLFCHGFLMDHTMFDPQVEDLGSDVRCVRFDARGFGETPADGPFDYWDLADDAVGLLDELGIEEAVFCGMSQGGYLSLRAALAHPDRVKGLVLIDTQAAADDEEAVEGYREMFDTWREHGPVDELVETIAGMILGDDEELRAEWIGKWREMPPERFEHPVECLLGRDDITDRLGEIECPTLVIHGEDDPAIPLERARELEEGLPASVGIVPIPGAAHAPNLTHPELVNPALRAFLNVYG